MLLDHENQIADISTHVISHVFHKRPSVQVRWLNTLFWPLHIYKCMHPHTQVYINSHKGTNIIKIWMHCLSVSITVIKTMTKGDLERNISSNCLQSINQARQVRKLWQQPGVMNYYMQSMEDGYLVVCSSWLAKPVFFYNSWWPAFVLQHPWWDGAPKFIIKKMIYEFTYGPI